ncbi:MAG: hypothetical protein Q9160_005921 [Pyrenula sp. 1 TL-2023]
MADPLSAGAGIVGVIGVAAQVIQFLVQSGLDWKDAPHDVRIFMAELQTLKRTLSETHTNLILNPEYTEAFQSSTSLLLSQLGPSAPPTTETKLLLGICEEDLRQVLKDLEKRSKGHRVGWERLKGAFLSKRTRESVIDLHRQCQTLNNLVSIDTAILGAETQNNVKDVRREQMDVREEEELAELLTWLSPVDHATQQNDCIAQRQEGTGQWIKESEAFREWVDQNNKTIFCPGIPGAGKTISTAIVVEELYSRFQHDPGIGIAYVYFSYQRHFQQQPVDMLANLLKQLIQGLGVVPPYMEQLYDQHKRKRSRPSISEILEALISTIRAYSRTFILVDALDECQITSGRRDQFIAELFNLQAETSLNTFVTSRFVPDIEKQFDGRSGRFLLAQLHLDSIVGKRSPKALRTALGKLAKGSEAYDQVYREAMERIAGQVADHAILAKEILSWITRAQRPLTTLHLQHALAVEIDTAELDHTNISEIEHIVSVCAGLVTVDKESDIVRLVHYTTQEFLNRRYKDWFPDAEANIADVCITYLSFDEFESGSCAWVMDYEIRRDSYPLYEYVSQEWGNHLRRSGNTILEIPMFLRSEAKLSASAQAMLEFDSYEQSKCTRGIHLAARFGLTELVHLMIDEGADPNCRDFDGQTPLSLAAMCGHSSLVEWLSERGDVIADSEDSHCRTPLSHAAEKGHVQIAKILLDLNVVDVNSSDQFQYTPLIFAARSGQEEMVRFLLGRDRIDPNLKDRDASRPLHSAVLNGHMHVTKVLLESNLVDPNTTDKNGETPLAKAASNGNDTIIKLFLKHANVEKDTKNRLGRTPLSLAAEKGHKVVVELLLSENEIDPDSSSERKGYLCSTEPGQEAVKNDQANVTGKKEVSIQVLGPQNSNENISKPSGFDGSGTTPRHQISAISGTIDRTPLAWAASWGRYDVVQLLLNVKSVDPNRQDREGMTPLILASTAGLEKTVRLLLDNEVVDPNIQDHKGWTALSRAAENGYVDVIQLLLDNHAVDPKIQDRKGATALSHAISNGRGNVIRPFLRQNMVDGSLQPHEGYELLSWAAQYGEIGAIKLLLARDGMLAYLKGPSGRTPLFYAIQNGHKEAARLLESATV